MKQLKEYNSFLNEGKLKNPSKTFAESRPRGLNRQQIFDELVRQIEMMEEYEVDQDGLKIALQDDKICQKYTDAYYKWIDGFEGDFDDRMGEEQDFAIEFMNSNGKLKKLVKSMDDIDDDDN